MALSIPRLVLFGPYLLTLLFPCIPTAAYTLAPSQSISGDGEFLISQGGTFKLGFFRPSNSSKNKYLGIWYNTIPVQTVVWVANRDSPLVDAAGVLKINATGDLVLYNQENLVLWSSSSSKAVETPIVEFLESGNLVLRDLRNDDPNDYLWQSFDYPSDTLLPGMKLGWNLKTGTNSHLTAWRNSDDPSRGDYTFGLELNGYPQFILRHASDMYYRDGSWTGIQSSGSPELNLHPKFVYEYIDNAGMTYFTYQMVNRLIIWRMVLTQRGTKGHIKRMAWVSKANSWVLQVQIPRDRCDEYALCGIHSSCDLSDIDICRCLKGFKPKSPQDWAQGDWSQGCERNIPLNCSEREGFIKHESVKLPDTTGSRVNASMTLEECKAHCLKNCCCTAFTNSDVRDGGKGCLLWFTDLVDMRHLGSAGQDIYIRMSASEFVLAGRFSSKFQKKQRNLILIACITSVIGAITLVLGSFFIWKKIILKDGSSKNELKVPLHSEGDDPKLPLYDLVTIKSATNNFSIENKLGEGGFGAVYKGTLDGNEDIAVKRLSTDSIQGVDELKNEVRLISKLQHRNLVRILGCCVQGEEKMLVYEYMQNKSLDSFIFDQRKRRELDWQSRFEIILGIARGLLYLHHDSRLRIIHRVLKASNILLDHDMVPQISDFGMARIFKGDQMEARTRRIVGTHGYMSPEYVVDGRFSMKSDVFSFGVIVLEIISGKRNRGFSHPDHELNLLGHAWRLWSEDRSMELVDGSVTRSYLVTDVSRCVQIGLLCVQKAVKERPMMSSVVLMLISDTAILPRPEPPCFYTRKSTLASETSVDKNKISNEITITLSMGR